MQLDDGNFIVEGELLEYDGKVYTLRSKELGLTTFQVDKFTCIAGKCPEKKGNPFAFYDSVSDFNIHGSNTIGVRLMPWIIRAYAKSKGLYTRETQNPKNKEVRFALTSKNNKTVTNITLQRHGSTMAFTSLANRKAVLGMSDRKINTREIAALENIGARNVLGKHEHVIGIDGVVIITSPKNPVTSLSREQIAAIFSGKIRNWSEIGGKPGKIKVYTPGINSGSYKTFEAMVMKPLGLSLASASTQITENEKLSRIVSRDVTAIGLSSFAYTDNAKAIGIKTACGLINRASAFNVQTGEYPLSRRLYLYTSSVIENRHAVELLNFAKSSEDMNSVLNVAGFINQQVYSMPFNNQKERVFVSMSAAQENFSPSLMRSLLSELDEARQLSYTARFKPNSLELNSESIQSFKRLIKYLKTGFTKDQHLIIAGFADSGGPFDRNTQVSLKRAEIVRAAILRMMRGKIDASRIHTRGYSELLPTACNNTEYGRMQNRRVEIWTLNAQIAKKLKPQKLPVADNKKKTPGMQMKSIAEKQAPSQQNSKQKIKIMSISEQRTEAPPPQNSMGYLDYLTKEDQDPAMESYPYPEGLNLNRLGR